MHCSEVVPYSVKLGPGHGHAPVILRVGARAAEGLLSKEDQVLLRQASVRLHLCLVLHIESIAQLWPHDFVRNEERDPALNEGRNDQNGELCWNKERSCSLLNRYGYKYMRKPDLCLPDLY